MRTRAHKFAFNRGLVSRLGLARSDVKRLAMAAQIQKNWVARTLGSMMLRPGMGHLGSSRGDAFAVHLNFEFAVDDKAICEVTDGGMRVWVDDAVIEREDVDTAVANGTFDTDLTSWTDADEAGGTSAWQTGGYLGLTGNGTAFAIRRQEVAVALADQNVEHGLHLVIERGPVVLRVGSATGLDDLVNETTLGTGHHSLAVTPTGGSIWIEFKSSLKRIVLVDSVAIEAAGDMVVEAPWAEADLRRIRFDQSNDILYVAAGKADMTDHIGYQQRKIERRAHRSWSIVLYQPEDGPFEVENVGPITITPSAVSGNITLTASHALFRAGHEGALFQVTSEGQFVTASITAENTFTNAIRVTNVNNARIFTRTASGLSGTGSTVTLQRSLESESGPWVDVSNHTADFSNSFDDGLDNQVVWYRIGVKTGNYAAGTIVVSLDYALGFIDGVVRITGVTSATVVDAEVITDLGGTDATDGWAEGSWSDYRGWPTAVALHEGRLTWPGRNRYTASVSDGFESFDPAIEGDSAPIQRSIGAGSVSNVNWALSLQREILGGDAAEFSVRSSSLDEPLTALNYNCKKASSQGSAPVAAGYIDQTGIMVQRGGTRIYQIAFGEDGVDYKAKHLSALIPEIGRPGIVKLAVQRQPDTRVHFLRSDGTVALLIFDEDEQVTCWGEVETDGMVEDIVILPGASATEEDQVYYSVKRTIQGVEKRFLERWATEDECLGNAPLCKLADSFVAYTGPATTTVSAPHLAGEEVVIWADGADVGTDEDDDLIYTLDGSGEATLPAAASNYVVGLYYEAPWQSAKLVELVQSMGGSLTDAQAINGMSLILADVHHRGLRYGQDFTRMDDLPQVEGASVVADDTVHEDYVLPMTSAPGKWDHDARVCLLAAAPRPATVLCAIAEVEHHG